MPSIKRNVKAAEDRSGFEPYEGPIPRPGTYRGVIKALKIREAQSGRLGIQVTTELEATPGSDAAKYDGYASHAKIWLGDEEALQSREKAFYIAIGVTGSLESVNLVHDDLENNSAKITKIGNLPASKIIGTPVLVQLNSDSYEGGDGVAPDAIYKAKTKAAGKVAKDSDEDEEDVDDEIEDADESDEEDESEEIVVPDEADLKKMAIKDLRTLATELGIETDGLRKNDLIEAILEDDEVEDEEDEEDLEDAEDEEESEDDEVEDEEEDAEETLRAELADLDRAALKVRLKKSVPDYRVLTRHTDDDLRDAIVNIELGDEPPF